MRETALVTAMLMAACATHAAETPKSQLPEMVVTPTGQAVSVNQLGHSVSVITADQIVANGWRTLPEALRSMPGMHIVQSGAPGSTVSIFVRGSRTSHVLVLVDGVRMNDPSAPTREAYSSGLDLTHVERIEVVRGPQSGLYGADAISGVINIITKRSGEGTHGAVSMEAGSYDTYRASAEVMSRQGKVSGSASVSYLDSKGFSSASEAFEGNTEADGVERLNASARVGVDASDAVSLEAFVRYVEWSSDYDAGSGPNADAEGNVADNEQMLTGFRAKLGTLGSRWQQTVRAQYSSFDRTFEDSWGRSSFDGDNWETEWRHDLAVSDAHNLSLGLSYRDESAESDSLATVSADNKAAYLQDQMHYGAFDAVVGLRYDDHEAFGDKVTYRLAPSYLVEKTKTRLKGSVGTGYKAPSLYQLYAPATVWGPVGNADLKPETSLGWDVGIEQTLLPDRITMGVTYFASDVEDLIDYGVGYQNVSEVESRGVELLLSVTPTDRLSIDATFTYTDSENTDTGEKLIRIPKDRATLAVGYAISSRARANASVLYVGSRNDVYYDATMFASVPVKADAYTVVNLSGSVDVCDTVTLFARIDNLFDETYSEVYGYGTAGLSAYGGVKVTL